MSRAKRTWEQAAAQTLTTDTRNGTLAAVCDDVVSSSPPSRRHRSDEKREHAKKRQPSRRATEGEGPPRAEAEAIEGATNAEERSAFAQTSNYVTRTHAAEGGEAPEAEESIAEWYASGGSGWHAQEQEGEEAGEHAQALFSVSMEEELASSAHDHMSFASAPVLHYASATQQQLSELSRTGEELRTRVCAQQHAASASLYGMPMHTQSLRHAIKGAFAGKKKLVSEEETDGLECVRCKKRGHTRESCPDQMQEASADEGGRDAWVRQLINQPPVDIAVVNAQLTLEQGVAAWKERGARMNAGNPWEGSARKEDSLRRMLGYHKAMGMGSVHLGWIGFGVPLMFSDGRVPRALAFKNNKTAEEYGEFVDREHASSLADGSYRECTRGELLGICPLQVVKNESSQKLRLIQDLRWINGHIPNVKFRMESLYKELGDVVRQGDKLLTTDIAKAYYCLPMHPDAQRYLGWSWRGKYYMPTCLVFGLSSAPRVFTKIMRPMMAFMRSLNVRVLGMIDDYLWADTPERILHVRDAVQSVMSGLGWSLNAKCVFVPQDEVLMLGMLINSHLSQVRAPPKKVAASRSDIERMLSRLHEQQPVAILDVQRVAGRLMSMMLAYGGVRVFTRHLYRAIAMAQEENESRRASGGRQLTHLQMEAGAVEELSFWKERLLTHNGHEIHCRETQVQVLMWSDASDVGWGGEAAGAVTQLPAAQVEAPLYPVAQMAFGELPHREIARSSTRRELVALLLVARTPSILAQIRGKRVRVILDSVPALRNLIKGGGPVRELCAAVKEWQLFCEAEGIKPTYEWVERAVNWRADQASKLLHQQHTWKHASMEAWLRAQMNALPATQWRKRNNHFLYGAVPVFLPMFHQVDARVEMIRSQLEEAVIVVPRWPAGGTSDWYRRIRASSIAQWSMGRVRDWYKESPRTGHNDELEAFWLMGRRGEKARDALRAAQSASAQ